MEIDFHFGVTYVVARVAGFEHQDAEIIATSAQYVDDTVNHGALNFKTGQSFNRISSSHAYLDYALYIPSLEKLTWVPFHFVPGNDSQGPHSEGFYNRLICRPNSPIAKEMLEECLMAKGANHSLHRLGITSHVFIDTWAHQGFVGDKNKVNIVRKINLELGHHHLNSFRLLLNLLKGFQLKAFLSRIFYVGVNSLFDVIFPMGHGAALHYPDHPFRKWSYQNGFKKTVVRDNPTDFLTAADELHKFFDRYLKGSKEGKGLPAADKQKIADFISEFTSDDGKARLNQWLDKINAGVFSFGKANPTYFKPLEKSWKYLAYGGRMDRVFWWQKFNYRPEFMNSDWKLFHDALHAHQFTMLRKILPKFGICVI